MDRRPRFRWRGPQVEPRIRRAARLRPVLVKPCFQHRDGGSGHPEVGVTPVLRRVCITEPVIGNTSTAGERHVAVDDEDLAVRPVVDLLDRVPLHGVERADLDTGALQPLDVLPLHRAGPDGVDDQADLDAAGRRSGQRGRELFRDRAAIVDVRLEVDAPPCLPDGVQQRGEDLDPVGEDPVLISARDPAPRERGDIVRKHGVFGCDAALDVQRFLVLREQQRQPDDDDDDQEDFEEQRHSSTDPRTDRQCRDRLDRGALVGKGSTERHAFISAIGMPSQRCGSPAPDPAEARIPGGTGQLARCPPARRGQRAGTHASAVTKMSVDAVSWKTGA